MRKVIKILLKLISAALLLLIILPVLLSILLTIPSVQNRLIERATSFSSDYLGTRVDIGAIHLGVFGNVKIRDFYVEDFQQDTLLYVKNAEVQIQKFSLNARELKFGYGQVEGGVLNLRQSKDSIMNIKTVVDKLIPKTPAKKSMEVSFGKLTVSGVDVVIDLLNHRNPTYGVDYGDMKFQDITAELTEFSINGASVHAQIKKMSLTEKSGFEVKNLSSELYVNSGILNFENCTIDSRHSHITAPYISVVGGSWSEYRNFVESVDIDAKLNYSTISSDDIAYFAPTMQHWGVLLTGVYVEVEGEVDDLNVNLIRSQFEEASSLSAKVHITSLPNFRNSHISADIAQSKTTSTDISRLYTIFTRKEPSEPLQEQFNMLGDVTYSGVFKGKLTDFATTAAINTSVGALRSTITLKEGEDGSHVIDGDITTDALELGKILKSKELGRVWMSSTITADINNPMQLAVARGDIDRVELRGEMLRNVIYDGHISNGELYGEVSSRNRGLGFYAIGRVDMRQEQMTYEADVSLNDIDLRKWQINRRDSISRISAVVALRGEGNNINDINGEIQLSNIEYLYNSSKFVGDTISVVMRSDSLGKSFEFASDYVDLSYRSRDTYQESLYFLRNSMSNYLPALYSEREISKLKETKSEDMVVNYTDSYSMLSIDVKDMSPLNKIFVEEGITISNDSRLDLMYSTTSHDISVSAKSQYVELNSVLALDLNLDATNTMDSLSVYGSFKELLVGTRQFKDISITGGIINNKAQFTAGYNNEDESTSTTISAIANLSNDPQRGRMASVRLLPSQIVQGEQQWNVKARNIEIDRSGVAINHFVIQNDKQELLIEGLASRSPSDTVRIDMHNFDLSILSSVTQALGYNVEGVTNGDVVASSALYNMRVEANIMLDSVSVNELPAPPMNLRAAWDAEQNQAIVSLTNRIKKDTLIQGYFIPAKAKYYAKMEVDSLHLGLLDAPLKGILSSTTGYANASLSVSGERRAATLEGHVDINNMESRVDYTNVTYRVPNVRIDVKDNELTCRNVIVTDTLNNQGVMTMNVSLQHLSNIAYHIRLNVDDFLALNTTVRDNDLFYGTMFATGVVEIKGNKAGVNMDITATTNDNSEFFMPLSSKANISTAEFIKFVTPEQRVDTTDIMYIKSRFFENDRRKREARQSNLNINMSLSVTPDADFQLVIDPTVGDIIRGRGEGRINMRVNPRANIFDMYGDYTIVEGNYLFTLRNIVNKRFVINPGSTIQWSGDPLDARLD
ncbi:MAG: hypothetical protein SNI57_04585, partial [Rikenellaceae bacterium]